MNSWESKSGRHAGSWKTNQAARFLHQTLLKWKTIVCLTGWKQKKGCEILLLGLVWDLCYSSVLVDFKYLLYHHNICRVSRAQTDQMLNISEYSRTPSFELIRSRSHWTHFIRRQTRCQWNLKKSERVFVRAGRLCRWETSAHVQGPECMLYEGLK